MMLNGRNIVLTGASQGLGAAIAETLVCEGASVLLCSRSMDPLKEVADRLRSFATPGQTIALDLCDISNEKAVDAFISGALRLFPRIDALVNNAGVQGPIGLLENVDWEEWKSTIATNLYGPIYLCRSLIPHFKKYGYGKIVNLSGGGATTPLPRFSAYAASKVAMVRLTETLASELRQDGIDVNAMAPGMLNTRMTRQMLDAGPAEVGESYHARIAKMFIEGGSPLDNAAALCAYLCSAASDGITGKLIAAPWDPWPFSEQHRSDLIDSDIFTLRRILPEERGKAWGQ